MHLKTRNRYVIGQLVQSEVAELIISDSIHSTNLINDVSLCNQQSSLDKPISHDHPMTIIA